MENCSVLARGPVSAKRGWPNRSATFSGLRLDKFAFLRRPIFCVILRVSLHFIGAASKLTLLYLCKGNALRCFLYGIM